MDGGQNHHVAASAWRLQSADGCSIVKPDLVWENA